MKPLSLYLHFPFCARKCAYCDFPSQAGREALIPAYVDALAEEIIQAGTRWPNRQARTIFFGGGTPSLLSGEQLARLMEALKAAFPPEEGAEITLEANPGTLTEEKLNAYRQSGVNRLSVGAQSFDERLLKDIGRIHTREEALWAVQSARRAGFSAVNVDLMYGLPGQTKTGFLRDVREALALDIPHVSLYSLIVEEGTPLAARKNLAHTLPDEEETLEMQHGAEALLAGAGVNRYEISNYARPGFECRHNLAYWRREEYLGLGCAAHSLMDETRFSNTASLDDYLRGARRVDSQPLTRADQAEEMVMLSLRTREGLPLSRWQALLGAEYPPRLEKAKALCREGLGQIEGDSFRLTQRGMDVLNAVVAALA